MASVLGADWVVPTIWSGTDLSSVDLTAIAKPFVVKANHGSGWNIFVRSDAELDVQSIHQKCADWLNRKYGSREGEWHYSYIKPQILIEPFLGDPTELPIDYKFFVFHGKVHFIQVDVGRQKDHRRFFYSRDWQKQPFTIKHPLEDGEFTRPHSLPVMLAAVESIARGFDFVRMDFYEINHTPLFGEITFSPGSGLQHFYPATWDTIMGQYWTPSV